MIARLAGLAVDARAAARSSDPRERALAARWIAANLMAILGVRIGLRGKPPGHAQVLGLCASDLTGALAAIATVPALLDATTLPWHWRLALRALGMPFVDRPVSVLLARGASVARCGARSDVTCTLAVGADHLVRVEPSRYELVA